MHFGAMPGLVVMGCVAFTGAAFPQAYPTVMLFQTVKTAVPLPCGQGGTNQFTLKQEDSTKDYFVTPSNQQLNLTGIHGYVQLPAADSEAGIILKIFSGKPGGAVELRFETYAHMRSNGVVPFDVGVAGGVAIPAGWIVCPSLVFVDANGAVNPPTGPADLADKARLYFSGFLSTPRRGS